MTGNCNLMSLNCTLENTQTQVEALDMDLHVNQLPSSNFFFFPLIDQTFYHPSNQLHTFPNSPIEDIQKRERRPTILKKKNIFDQFVSFKRRDEYLGLLRSSICDLIEKLGIWHRPIWPRPGPVRRERRQNL